MSNVVWTQVRENKDRADHCDERSLIESAKRHPHALADLYRRHYAAIAGYVHRRVGDEHEAEDIVSDVFLSMVKNLRRYRWRGVPFRIWLIRLATTELSRWARRRRRWATQQLMEVDLSSKVDRTPDSEVVDLVLSTLPQRLQTVMSLRYLEGLKIAEIAEVVGCPPGTVKSRLSDGRKLMCERLKKRGF